MIEKVLASTVRIDFTTHDSTGALVAPSSAFASDGSDFRIYKDGSASEKTTVNGITVTSPFDSITGKHLIEIDTNNSTGDSGFWATGSEYRVEINSAKTVASIVQSGVTVGRFRLVSADVLRPSVSGRTLNVSSGGEGDAVLNTTTQESIADSILSRNVSNVEATAGEHTLATAILGMLEWEISGNDLIIKRTDGTTVHYTKTLSSATGTGDVITGLN